MYKSILLTFCYFYCSISIAGTMTAEEYIQTYKKGAIAEMEKSGIPASITLAQGMLESGNGNSALAVKAKNHFGIKCHSSWNGPTYIQDDDKKNECFRKYSSVYQSYNDHSLFLKRYSRYAFLFDLKITDYKGWAKGLKKAGYATNPKYPELLIRIIETHKLYEYDLLEKKNDGIIAKRGDKKKNSKAVAKSASVKSTRKIYRMGIKKYILIEKGDTFYSIAKETDKDLWQLYKYNNLTETDMLIPGGKLYLQPKRNRASVDFHTVKAGETMKSISQYYGIKLAVLYRKNNMKDGDKPNVGQVLYMKKYKSTAADY